MQTGILTRRQTDRQEQSDYTQANRQTDGQKLVHARVQTDRRVLVQTDRQSFA